MTGSGRSDDRRPGSASGREAHDGSDAGPCVGVDGCRGGWVVAIDPADRAAHDRAIEFHLAPRFVDALALVGPCAIVAIDMPIGLLDQARPGGRGCDVAARAGLPRGRKSSVFTAPARGALEARTHAEAQQANGGGLSIQAFHLIPRIREIDAVMTPVLQSRVFEAHPELAFATRAGGAGLPAKKTREGAAAREALLRALPGFAPFDDPGAIRAVLGTARTAIDDVLDALVLVDVARSIRAGTAGCVPGPDQACVDARGLRMEICF